MYAEIYVIGMYFEVGFVENSFTFKLLPKRGLSRWNYHIKI